MCIRSFDTREAKHTDVATRGGNTSLEFQVQLKAARDIDRGIARHREAARGGARQREAE